MDNTVAGARRDSNGSKTHLSAPSPEFSFDFDFRFLFAYRCETRKHRNPRPQNPRRHHRDPVPGRSNSRFQTSSRTEKSRPLDLDTRPPPPSSLDYEFSALRPRAAAETERAPSNPTGPRRCLGRPGLCQLESNSNHHPQGQSNFPVNGLGAALLREVQEPSMLPFRLVRVGYRCS